MIVRTETFLKFQEEVFDGCDHTWRLGIGEFELPAENGPWLRSALKERSIRSGYLNKRDMVEKLLDWEQRRCTQVTLWGNPRYCQNAWEHDPHPFTYRITVMDCVRAYTYECDGRKVDELTV